MTADTTRIDVATATPLELLLLADEAEEGGAGWEEVCSLRIAAWWASAWGPGELPLAVMTVGQAARSDLLSPEGPGGPKRWRWVRRPAEDADPAWGDPPDPSRSAWLHEGERTWHDQPPPQVRRLVEAAAEEAVRRVLAAEGVTGAGPGA